MTRQPLWPLLAGMLAGAIGAVIASLVSLPLQSPDDLIANTASVTLIALVIGIGGGIYWRRVYGAAGARRKLLGAALAGFIGSVVVLAILEAAVLSRFVSFGVPIAAIIFAAVGLLTPLLTNMDLPVWSPLVGVVVALALGGVLASFGDTESGDLSLDDLVTTAAPTTSTAGGAGEVPTTPVDPGTNPPAGSSVLDQLAATTFSFTGGTATWSVPETFAGGLDATAVGRSENLTDTIDLRGTSEIRVDLTTFVSDQERRDTRVRSIFAADPVATFTTSDLTLPPAYTEGDVFATEVTGELTINGVTRTVTWGIDARIVGTQLDVTGELDIALTDFGIEPPSVGGFVSVEDRAKLEVLFSAAGA